ncbi:ABC transporter transmembrane domain-containing protein [Lacticaseibacillus daqingensis]|uniref:ABC transporter transmembrane domain-containing protein n=1 Tax=Lacticaseibacillus daqingensis TaxID=2486014 RepID=UPI000F76F610|nr:ABC transporter ATP-binding protein [Lacticaseibacillus daqingensis]
MRAYAKHHPWRLFGYVVIAPIAALTQIGFAQVLRMITAVLTGTLSRSYGWLVAVVCGYLIVACGFFYLDHYWSQAIAAQAASELRNRVFRALTAQSLSTHRQLANGRALARLTTQVDTVQTGWYLQLLTLYGFIVEFLLAVGTILWTAPALTVAILLLVLPGLLLPVVARRWLTRAKLAQLEAVQRYTALVADRLNGFSTMALFNLRARFNRQQTAASQQLYQATARQLAVTRAVQSLGQLFSNTMYLGTWVIGARFVLNGQLTLADLVAFSQLVIFVSEPLEEGIGLLAELPGGLAAARQLATPVPQLGQGHANVARVSLTGVAATMGHTAVLEDVTLRLDLTRRYLLVGASGAGKSALLSVLLEALQPTAGTMRYETAAGEPVSCADFVATVAVAPQAPDIFAASLADNIRLFDDTVSPAAVAQAASAAALALPLDKPLSAEGANLSGGEQKRLGLARALLVAPEFLIADEPLAGLDGPQAATVSHSIVAQSGGFLVVTHQFEPTLLAAVDTVIVMHAGRVVATGAVSSPVIQQQLQGLAARG